LIRNGTLIAAETGSIDKPYSTFCHERWGSLIDRPQLTAWFEQLTNRHGLSSSCRPGDAAFSGQQHSRDTATLAFSHDNNHTVNTP
jgi:hypothetical protein